jgi:signal transduction histidine kinase/ligand-binding sensor domain-containing protein
MKIPMEPSGWAPIAVFSANRTTAFIGSTARRSFPWLPSSPLGRDQKRLLIASSAGLLTVVNDALSPVHCAGIPITGKHSLYQSPDGAVRLLDAAGASRLHDGCAAPDPAIPAVRLTHLLHDHDGNLWMGTLGKGLWRSRLGVNAKFELPNNHITALFEDRQDNIWIGGSDGLMRLSKTAVSTVGARDGLVDENVSSVYEDRHKTLWLATLTGQLYKLLSNGVPTRFHLPAPAGSALIRNVFEDSKGVYWFGTVGQGVVRLQGGAAVTLGKAEGLRSNDVRQVAEDRVGRIWIATGSGLALWDGSRFQNYYLDAGLSYPSVRALTVTRNGDLLVGTDGGLDLVRDRRIVPHAVFAKVGKEKIWAIHEDSTGAIWLGTRGGGLSRIKDTVISHVTTKDGLPGNTIYQIIEDKNGKFWFSGPLGVFSAERRELDRIADGGAGPAAVVTYGSGDGMETSQLNGGWQPAGVRSSSGEVWFASIKGAVRINPEHLPAFRAIPVLIERVTAGGRAASLLGTVTIPPNTGRLAIDFTAANLTFPQRQGFRYRLENFEESWTPVTKLRTATYTNVPPGQYRFRIQSTEAGAPGLGSETSLEFVIEPAFHQTYWFYGLSALAVGGAIWAAFWLHTRQTAARYALLLAERTRLAREMHDTVIQGCVGVSTLLEASSRYQRSNVEEANKLRDQARAEVKATIQEARQAVWNLRHAETEASEPAVTAPGLREFINKLATESAIQTETETIGDPVPLDLPTDRILLLVGREALRNAMFHGRPTRVAVRFVFRPGEIRLEIQDDGEGFDPASSRPDNGHYGIVGMRERVEQAGGSFTIRSQPGNGTLVVAELPISPRFPGPAPSPLPASGPTPAAGSR